MGWDGEVSSTSDLLCNSGISSSLSGVRINPLDLLEETDQMYDNVEVILNWLID